MYDYTQTNDMYQRFQENLMLKELFRNCKTEEEKQELRQYQGMSLSTAILTFVLALVICTIISLFI